MNTTASPTLTPDDLMLRVALWEQARSDESRMQLLMPSTQMFVLDTSVILSHWQNHEMARAYFGIRTAESNDPLEVYLTFLTGYEDDMRSRDTAFSVNLSDAYPTNDPLHNNTIPQQEDGPLKVSGESAQDMITRWQNTREQWIHDHIHFIPGGIPLVVDIPLVGGFLDFASQSDTNQLYIRVGLRLDGSLDLLFFNTPDPDLNGLFAADFTTPKPPFRFHEEATYSFLSGS